MYVIQCVKHRFGHPSSAPDTSPRATTSPTPRLRPRRRTREAPWCPSASSSVDPTLGPVGPVGLERDAMDPEYDSH